MKKLVIFIIVALSLPTMAEQKIYLLNDSSLSMVIPDVMQRVENKNERCFFSAECNEYSLNIYYIDQRGSGFNPKAMDKALFPGLNPDSLLEEKQEFFLSLGRDYIKRLYHSDGVYVTTFSSHINGLIITFLFITSDKSNLEVFDDILRSIDYDINILAQGYHAYTCSKTMWLIIIIMLSILSIALYGINGSFGEKVGVILLVTLAEAAVFAIPLWGYWGALLCFAAVMFVVNFIGCFVGMYFTVE